MANDDDRDRRKRNSNRSGRPDLVETCIGVWSRSTKTRKVSEEEQRKICNGINVVILSPDADVTKVKPSRTRGLQIVVRETEKSVEPSRPKAYDHTYIRVDREETKDKLQKNEDNHAKDTTSTDEQDTPLTERVKDVILMKKPNHTQVSKEKETEQRKNEINQQGRKKDVEQKEEQLEVRTEEIFWTGFHTVMVRFANCYETTGRILSYCHPFEKIGQLVGFAERCIKSAGRRFVDDNDDKKKR